MKKRQLLTVVWAATLLSLTILTLDTPLARTIEWQTEKQLTTNTTQDMSPAIMQAENGTIWVVWVSNRMGFGNDELYYKTSSNYGLTWSTENRLTVNASYDEGPSVMQASNGTIWVVWSSYRTGNYELFYKTFNGSSWSSDVQFTEESHQDMGPSIIQSSDGLIWVVWYSDRTGNSELFYKTYNGSTWSPETQLTDHPSADMYPSVAEASNGTIWVVWSSYRTGNYELFYKIFDGATWSGDNLLTNDSNSDLAPSTVRARDASIWVVWQSGRPSDAQDELYYKIYNGSTWTSDTQLTNNRANDIAPSIAQIEDKRIWVVWQADRDDDFELYYVSSQEIVNHDVAITSVTPSPVKVNLGEIVSITVGAQNQGDVYETFTANCYANKTMIGATTISLVNGTSTELTFSWNTTGFAKGSYTITAYATPVPGEIDTGDNTYACGTVLVTLVGDVNADGIVNILDMAAVSAHWYPGPPAGPLGYDANFDINDDDAIDILDAAIVSAYWTGPPKGPLAL